MLSLLQQYAKLINKIIRLRKGLIHNKFMNSIDDLIQQGFTEEEAVNLVVNQHKNHIESLLLSHNDNDTKSDTSDEDLDDETEDEAPSDVSEDVEAESETTNDKSENSDEQEETNSEYSI